MKVFLFKHSVLLVYFLGAAVFVLMIATFLLYAEKNKMQVHNQALILQNDSILSEHILLKNEFGQQHYKPSSRDASVLR